MEQAQPFPMDGKQAGEVYTGSWIQSRKTQSNKTQDGSCWYLVKVHSTFLCSRDGSYVQGFFCNLHDKIMQLWTFCRDGIAQALAMAHGLAF